MHEIIQQAVNWLVPALCGGALTACGIMWRWGRALLQGMCALLRAELIRIHEAYVQAGRPIPVEVKDEADDVYASYHQLGGNGLGTRLHQEIMAAHIGPDVQQGGTT